MLIPLDVHGTIQHRDGFAGGALEFAWLRQSRAVYDMIYRPAETKFLGLAKAGGSQVANGLGMLLYQGAKALEIWTGQPAPVEVMRQALTKNVYGG
jgi:shikimate dehydrogenase